MKKVPGLLLLISLVYCLCGCQLLPQMLPTPLPLMTETPMLKLEQVPVMPTLPLLTPTPTVVPEKAVRYTKTENIFSRAIEEILPLGEHQKVVFYGTVGEEFTETQYDYWGNPYEVSNGWSVRHVSGTEFTVRCDDYCILTDAEKQLIGTDALQEGVRVVVLGASSEELSVIDADLIMVNIVRQKKSAERSEVTNLPWGMKYTEFELTGAPQLTPFSIEGIPTATPTSDPLLVVTPTVSSDTEKTLNDLLDERLHHSLEDIVYFSKGIYGEIYSVYTSYDRDDNRDPDYPTRSKMDVESSGYSFHEFWFPYVSSPQTLNNMVISINGDWYLSFCMNVDIDPDPDITEIVNGYRTIRSQQNFDREKGYLRSFGFSVFRNGNDYNLFYFFEKDSGYGIAVNNTEYDLGFDEIPYGYLDPYAALNPFFSDDLISFFGVRDGKWYYVELSYEKPIGYY